LRQIRTPMVTMSPHAVCEADPGTAVIERALSVQR
jgi:hypothetical protein